jgi:hypothetical protein
VTTLVYATEAAVYGANSVLTFVTAAPTIVILFAAPAAPIFEVHSVKTAYVFANRPVAV